MTKIKRNVAAYGFVVKFEGQKTMAINDRGTGEIGSYIQELGHKIAYCYIDNLHAAEMYTFVTLFSKEVDVSEIAQKFGGGGHRGAAGFMFPRTSSPFPSRESVEWPKHEPITE